MPETITPEIKQLAHGTPDVPDGAFAFALTAEASTQTHQLDPRAVMIARETAQTSEYAQARPAPALLAEFSEPFRSFCYVPNVRMQDIRNIAADFIDVLGLLETGWNAALAENAVREYEGKIIFPIPLMRSDGKTPVEISIRRASNRDGKLMPWFVCHVNSYVRHAPQKFASPSKALESFAWLGSWEDFLRSLEEIALDEQWDFEGAHESAAPTRTILRSYICTTFYRLQMEGKVAIAPDGSLAAFNTGLVNDRYDDVFACFEPAPGSKL